MAAFTHTVSALCLALSFLTVMSTSVPPPDSPLLMWQQIREAKTRGALCNDFSPAGYFLHTNPAPEINEMQPEPTSGSGSAQNLDSPILPDGPDTNQEENRTSFSPGRSKWVIYLEGGGGCTSPRSCNERFIDQKIRDRFTTLVSGSPRVDVAGAWATFQQQPLVVTSKLMTSLTRFAKEGYVGIHGGNRSEWGVEGRALLSTLPDENPDFYTHNHVLIPYCSSDLWLKNTKNYRKALSSDFSFQFDPELIREHQFTFRGMAIFRSVVADLFQFHGLSGAEEVVLVGSSAGGVGAMNHARWLQQELRQWAAAGERVGKIYVVLDSAWFIDFHGEITDQVIFY